jgi:cephalosporin hydroxylase
MGAKVLKCPLDLWVYQEIIFDTKPDLIIETGTRHGGSALYLASLCDLLGHGRVISIDIEPAKGRPAHPRITYLLGSSTSVQMIRDVETAVLGNAVMVSLDSDHSKAHVLEEMRLYSRFVSKGHYMIVEDTNVNGHPVLPEFGPGPLEAVEEFLVDHDEFQVDEAREKFLLTFHSRGFLKKIR